MPRGRPPHEPGEKERRVAEMLAGWAVTEERIALVVGIDPKTLRKHYGAELEGGHAKLEAQLAHNLLRIAQGHDRQALIATIFALKSRFGWVETVAPREPELGKKARAQLAVEIAGRDSDWGDLLKPPPPPKNYRLSKHPLCSPLPATIRFVET